MHVETTDSQLKLPFVPVSLQLFCSSLEFLHESNLYVFGVLSVVAGGGIVQWLSLCCAANAQVCDSAVPP